MATDNDTDKTTIHFIFLLVKKFTPCCLCTSKGLPSEPSGGTYRKTAIFSLTSETVKWFTQRWHVWLTSLDRGDNLSVSNTSYIPTADTSWLRQNTQCHTWVEAQNVNLTSQRKGFSPECWSEWTFKDMLRLKDFPHVSQVNGISLVWAR